MIPEGWRSVRLGSFAAPKRGITYKASNLAEYDEDYPLYLNMKSFKKDGGYNLAGEKYFSGGYKDKDVMTDRDLLVANTDVTPDGDIIGAVFVNKDVASIGHAALRIC